MHQRSCDLDDGIDLMDDGIAMYSTGFLHFIQLYAWKCTDIQRGQKR